VALSRVWLGLPGGRLQSGGGSDDRSAEQEAAGAGEVRVGDLDGIGDDHQHAAEQIERVLRRVKTTVAATTDIGLLRNC